MAFIDDLKLRLEQSAQNVGNDIQSYIQNRATDIVVKIGEPPKGNLTAVQIAQGAAGQGQGIAAPSGGSVQNSMQASQISEGFKKYLIPAIAVLAAGYFFFSKKSRG